MSNSYKCPHCGAVTAIFTLPIISRLKPAITHGNALKRLSLARQDDSLDIEDVAEILDPAQTKITRCQACGGLIFWDYYEIKYPIPRGIEPAKDMPKEALKEFCEAQSVIALSPRSACVLLRVCLEKLADYVAQTCGVPDYKTEAMLWEKIKFLGEKRGITSDIKEICDACRDTGNEFAHKGKYDLSESDTRELAEIMSELTNSLVDLWVKPAAKVARIRQLIPAKKR